MDKGISETLRAFLFIAMYAWVISVAVLLGILLMPLLMLALSIAAIREMIIWKRRKKQIRRRRDVPFILYERRTAVIRPMEKPELRKAG